MLSSRALAKPACIHNRSRALLRRRAVETRVLQSEGMCCAFLHERCAGVSPIFGSFRCNVNGHALVCPAAWSLCPQKVLVHPPLKISYMPLPTYP